MGEFVIEVRADRAPLTAANFLRYVREGFYQRHRVSPRVVANFVIQGGGYDATTQKVKATHEASSTSPATACRTSAARRGHGAQRPPHSGQLVQFFVDLVDNPDLD